MELSIFSVFVQGIGIVGIIASILSFQCAGHKRLLLLRTVNELCFGIQYGLLGAFTGMAMNLIGCIRNLVFMQKDLFVLCAAQRWIWRGEK